jgi:hypothetical protein
MMGMGGGSEVPNLRKLGSEDRVQTIRYCGDTYKVTTADGKTRFLGAEPVVQDGFRRGRSGERCPALVDVLIIRDDLKRHGDPVAPT